MGRGTVVVLGSFLLVNVLLAGVSGAQETAPASRVPGNMFLLPGYEHIREQGIDTSVGRIVKGDRTVIRYDIGPLAGVHVKREDRSRCGRYEEEDVRGQTMRLCVDGYAFTLYIVEASANFYGQAENQKELTDLIAMVRTYWGPHRVPSRAPAGWLKLPPGFTRVRERGNETAGGLIFKGDRQVIRYEIGAQAGVRVDPKEKDRCTWYQEEKAGEQTMRLCVSGNAFLLAFVEAGANFYGEARDQKELMSLVSMVKTYRSPQDRQLAVKAETNGVEKR